jgi:SapC
MSNHQILEPTRHADLRVHNAASAAFGDNVIGCLTTPSEFRDVQAHYPIVFRRDITTGAFSPLALFGFETGENLFLDGDRWDARYRPMAQAIQPFLIGKPASGSDVAQVHIDMTSPRISATGEGMRVFDMDGRPTPFLEAMATQLAELDQGHRQSPDFCSMLERLELLEPFTLEVPLKDGSRHSLVGYHIIAEERLSTLDGAALGDLQARGYLLPIFMAVASLSHFSDLVARKNARLNLD